MRKAIVVRGKLRDGRIVELEEPVEGVEQDVEVLMRIVDADETFDNDEKPTANELPKLER